MFDRPIGGGVRSLRADTFGHNSARWANAQSGQGTTIDRHGDTTFLPGDCLPWMTKDALMRFQGVARRIVFREPQDAIREGIGFESMDKQLEVATLAELERLEALPKISKARGWERAYGGGAIVVFALDGREPHEPIRLSSLQRIASLLVVDRHEITPHDWEDDPMNPNIGRPRNYMLHGTTMSVGTLVHHSRVILFPGLDVPNRELQTGDGFGASVLDLVWAELRNWGSSHGYAAEAFSLLTQGVFTSDISKAMRADGAEALVHRMETLRMGMGMLGDLLLDTGEKYEIQSRPMTGMGDALDRLTSALVAVTDMPRSILLGETPGGLNAGENAGEIRSWYDHVAALQPQIYTPRLMHLLSLIWRSQEGPTGGQIPRGWRVKWPPLWQLTEKEKAEVRKLNAEARAVDVNAGIVSGDEGRTDEDLEEHYKLDPDAGAPGLPGGGEEIGGEPTTEEDEVEEATNFEAPHNLIPKGEVPRSARELGEIYGVSATSIRAMARRGQIHAFRFGNRWRYLKSEIDRAIGATRADRHEEGHSGPFVETATP